MVNFPTSFDDNTTLFLVANNLRTQLTAPIDEFDLTIPVITTSGFPAVGYITILTGDDITQAEALHYTSLTPTQFNADQRGADGTPALSHSTGNNVDFTIVAAHHNSLKDAVLELEHFVGVSGSENFLRIDDGGNVIVPGNFTVIGNTNTGSLTTGTAAISQLSSVSGTFSQSLTVSGVPVATGTGSTILVSGTQMTGALEFRATGDLALHTAGQIITWSGFGVRRTGDSMSGTLEMSGNQVRHAGVVEIGPSQPNPTSQGLLWYDTSGSPADRFVQAGGFQGALVSMSGVAAVADSGFQTLGFDHIAYERGEWFDFSQPARLTVPSGVTHVQLQGNVSFESDATGIRSARVVRNGNATFSDYPLNGIIALASEGALTGGSTTLSVLSPVITVTGTNEYFEFQVFQDSGGPLDAEPNGTSFSIVSTSTRGVPGVNSINFLQGEITLLTSGSLNVSTDSNANTITLSSAAAEVSTTISGVIGARLGLEHAPVALWQLQGSKDDVSGNGYHLSSGSTLVDTELSNGLQGARIAHNITYSRAATPALLITGDITIQAIVQMETMVPAALIFARYGTTGETLATNVIYQFGVINDGQLRYFAEFGAGTDIDYASGTDFRLIAGPLYHVAMVRESDVITFYVNGRQFGASSSTLNTPAGGTSSVPEVGGGASAAAITTGGITSVKIIDRALTPVEIYEEYRRTWLNIGS